MKGNTSKYCSYLHQNVTQVGLTTSVVTLRDRKKAKRSTCTLKGGIHSIYLALQHCSYESFNIIPV